MKQASAAQLSAHTLHSAWIMLLNQISSFHKSCKTARVQSRVRSRKATQTLAHQRMTNLKGIMRKLKSAVSNLRCTLSKLKGTVSILKGTRSISKGTVSKSKGNVSSLKGIMSNLKGIGSNFKGTMSILKGTVRKSKGTVSSLKGIISDLKGTMSNLKGTASPRLAGTPVARAKGKSLEVLALVLQAFCITQWDHLNLTPTTRLCATCSAVP